MQQELQKPEMQAQMAQMQAVMSNPQVMQRMQELRVSLRALFWLEADWAAKTMTLCQQMQGPE